jgi:hypothetical protein
VARINAGHRDRVERGVRLEPGEDVALDAVRFGQLDEEFPGRSLAKPVKAPGQLPISRVL